MAFIGVHEYLMYAAYFAPRGKKRLLNLGGNIGQRYLSPEDKLVGLIGDAGAGKSLLIRGMFPGLELTNDDDGINVRPLPIMTDAERDHFRNRTYHIDVRFEAAFTPLWEISEAIKRAIHAERRVIIEHFELIYPTLGYNAEVLIGVGEEVIVTRPGVFGPFPSDIAPIVFKSLKYRKMAHSAEDLVGLILEEMGISLSTTHGDIKHGFILEFSEKPAIDLNLVEKKVLDYIARDIPIHYHDDQHIKVGEELYMCTGPRIHLNRTSDIKGFTLLKEFKWDPIGKLYVMAGLVGRKTNNPFDKSAAERFNILPEE
jgi:hypothetical protein